MRVETICGVHSAQSRWQTYAQPRTERRPRPSRQSGSALGAPGVRRTPRGASDALWMLLWKRSSGHPDYKGQKLAEQIFQGIILVSAVIGFIYGYITEQFGWTVYIVMVGFALSCLLTLPPWPMYRRSPLKWLPVQESGPEDKKPVDRKPKRHPK
ncbi:signal peptidase complex subunit 1 isoform X3 [Alligator sinensis]|uniref:Signal peptidase complex subunit 1 n=1 Tax=Alligator sinensis TaxID=38654 RepID=A0A1U7S7W9_ALLSI|nr:signal peptidase complex subunit 1 isoform X3 [Alligator sinensis]